MTCHDNRLSNEVRPTSLFKKTNNKKQGVLLVDGKQCLGHCLISIHFISCCQKECYIFMKERLMYNSSRILLRDFWKRGKNVSKRERERRVWRIFNEKMCRRHVLVSALKLRKQPCAVPNWNKMQIDIKFSWSILQHFSLYITFISRRAHGATLEKRQN